MSSSSVQSSLPNRWVLAITAFLMQLALGSVYAWSIFLNPVINVYHTSRPAANLTFSLVLLALGVTAGFGGYLNNRFCHRPDEKKYFSCSSTRLRKVFYARTNTAT